MTLTSRVLDTVEVTDSPARAARHSGPLPHVISPTREPMDAEGWRGVLQRAI